MPNPHRRKWGAAAANFRSSNPLRNHHFIERKLAGSPFFASSDPPRAAMIHITEQQVREALPMSKAIELVEEAFRRLASNKAVNQPRRRVVMENRTVLHYMAAGDNESGYLGTKVYATGRHGANFMVLLFEAATSALLATIEANALGQIRTGAASGVATRHMARKDAATLAMIGSGYQAETQLEAVANVRALSTVKVYSRSPERRAAFAEKMVGRLHLAIEPVETAAAAAAGADIISTVTNAREPVLLGNMVAPGCHINAAGSNHAKRREIDADTVARAVVVAADSVEQAQIEAGDLIGAAEEGRLDWSQVSELSSIVAGHTPGRTNDSDTTLFESQGLAVEDIAVAGYIYEQVSR